jgi:glycerol-3-phosphate dehydrogenase (NAD(P)+)
MATAVTVLGGGAWGTALAIHLARIGNEVWIWDASEKLMEVLRAKREHPTAHPGVRFPDGLEAARDMPAAIRRAEAVVVAVPSQVVRRAAESIRPHLPVPAAVVSVAKGVEEGTSKTMSAVLEEVLGPEHAPRVCALSGPSFAREVALGLPTAVTAAAPSLPVAEEVQQLFNGPTFRVYTSTDVVGVEIGGAVKNVIALAAGVSDGLGFGNNARAALITRGLAEIARLGTRLGANTQTLAGLSCLGDLVLTCTGDLSRNRTVGMRLGRGEKLAAILASMNEVAEGVRNTLSVCALAREIGVEMPISEQMRLVLYEDKDPQQAVVDLMSRPLKHELE